MLDFWNILTQSNDLSATLDYITYLAKVPSTCFIMSNFLILAPLVTLSGQSYGKFIHDGGQLRQVKIPQASRRIWKSGKSSIILKFFPKRTKLNLYSSNVLWPFDAYCRTYRTPWKQKNKRGNKARTKENNAQEKRILTVKRLKNSLGVPTFWKGNTESTSHSFTCINEDDVQEQHWFRDKQF